MFPRPVSTPRASGLGVGIAVLGAGALFAVLAGAGTALIGPMAAAVFAAMLLGIVALFLPIRWLVVGLVLVSFLITGQLIYFARIDKALWFPFLVGALMLVRFPLDRMQRGHRPLHEAEAAPLTPTAMKVCIALYMATLLSSTLFNGVPPLQMLVSFKEYLFLWGLFLVLAAGLVRPDFVLRIWSVLPWLMVLQLPLIAYQRFVVAPSRRNIGAAWDAVVGAFGGNPMAGGSSGAMGLFCVVMILVVIARWRAGLLPLWQTLLLGLSGLLGIGLAEIKFAVLLLPIGFALLFLREFARRPMQGLVAVAVGVALAGARPPRSTSSRCSRVRPTRTSSTCAPARSAAWPPSGSGPTSTTWTTRCACSSATVPGPAESARPSSALRPSPIRSTSRAPRWRCCCGRPA
jgi:hypothetical protein